MRIVERKVFTEVEQALQSAGASALMARLFASRGITDAQQLRVDLKNLLSPDGLLGNQHMAVLLADAITAGKKLLVVGDYDADGATATAVAIKGLRAFGATVDFLVPNRFEYGYGLTPEIVALAAVRQPDFIITVDNGIASVDGVAAAHALGIQVLITDHHLPGEATPQAACIVNPNQNGCTFSSKNLAGVGVMFYVLLALRAEFRARGAYSHRTEPDLRELLDLVALGTVADLVKLDDNNRILVEQGLRRIRAGLCAPGILALLRVSRCQYQTVQAQDLGFYVGPRLNAAGRLDDMSLGIQCLLADSTAVATPLAEQLQALNIQRRDIEADMQDSAHLCLEQIEVAKQFTLSLYQKEWHQGVIGILASRIKERYHRPTVVFAEAGEGLLKGSGRSIHGLHLRDALDLLSKRFPDLILKFGGHAMAAGLTIKQHGFEQFQQGFEAVVESLMNVEDLTERLEVDGSLSSEQITLQTAEELERQVWGQGFPPPLFYDVFTVVQQKQVGGKHLKLSLKKDDLVVEAIYFNQTDLLSDSIQAAYQLQTNTYNGTKSIQLNVREVIAP